MVCKGLAQGPGSFCLENVPLMKWFENSFLTIVASVWLAKLGCHLSCTCFWGFLGTRAGGVLIFQITLLRV